MLQHGKIRKDEKSRNIANICYNLSCSGLLDKISTKKVELFLYTGIDQFSEINKLFNNG